MNTAIFLKVIFILGTLSLVEIWVKVLCECRRYMQNKQKYNLKLESKALRSRQRRHIMTLSHYSNILKFIDELRFTNLKVIWSVVFLMLHSSVTVKWNFSWDYQFTDRGDFRLPFWNSPVNSITVFHHWIHVMASCSHLLILWPKSKALRHSLSMCFPTSLKNFVRIIEVFIEHPSDLKTWAQIWSNGKQHNMIKFLNSPHKEASRFCPRPGANM